MSGKQQPDALAKAFASALRESFRSWAREHGNGKELVELWTSDVQRIELAAHYTPQHRGLVVVEVRSKRPGRSELYPYSLAADKDGVRLQHRRGEV